jgi:outer membrane immunogenic protein
MRGNEGEKTMRNLIRLAMLLMVLLGCCSLGSSTAQAQDFPALKVGADYNYIRTNGPPGGCGCFSMNGGNAWVSVGLFHDVSAVAEVGSEGAHDIDGTGTSLTMTSYLFGPRYTLHKSRRIQPFGQALVGGAHANGSFIGGSSNAFASSVGGGLDLNWTAHFAVRAFEADYYFTHFDNGINDHQNNLRIGAGIVFRFGE